MSFPSYADIEMPLLEEIKKAGGQVKPKYIYSKVTAHFPYLTPQDLQEKTPSGTNKWKNMICFARESLCKKGELDREQRGLWKIKDKGQLTPPPPPPPPLDGPDKLAEQIKDFVDKLVELAKQSKPTPIFNHAELIKLGREIGEKLGKKVDTETGPIYKHDVSWKDNQYTTPGLVIEICDKGLLDKDLQSLSWAIQNWRATAILVTVDDKDYENARKKLGTPTAIHIIKAIDFQQLHAVVNSAGKDVLKSMFSI